MSRIPESRRQNHRVAAGDVDYKTRADGNSVCIFLLSGFVMAGFDGHCPHCNHDIGDTRLHAIWIDRDYGTDVSFRCDKCDKPIQMYVHSVPEFELEKPETEEEYQAKRAEMVARNGG